jgi:hypothetical protein
MANIMNALNIPEMDCERIYSTKEIGEMNIFVRFFDHIFHKLPTVIEYSKMVTNSQRSMPVKSEYAILIESLAEKNNDRNPNTIIDMSGNTKISMRISREWRVTNSSDNTKPFSLLIFI